MLKVLKLWNLFSILFQRISILSINIAILSKKYVKL